MPSNHGRAWAPRNRAAATKGGHEGRLDHVVDLGVIAGAQVGDEPMHDVDVALEQEPTRGAITGGAGRDQPGVAQRLVGRGAQGDELAAALTHSGVATPDRDSEPVGVVGEVGHVVHHVG
jgi:hypothetical protein